ncbi:MAG: flagellar type III secretion system pore protein FliP [Pseudomonadota bacterium]
MVDSFKRLARASVLAALLFPLCAAAADATLPGLSITLDGGKTSNGEVANALKIVLLLTVISLAPAILIAMTSFTRIIIVLSMLRHAMGMQETPPNTVLVSLALFLSLFTMLPVFTQINEQAFKPFNENKMAPEAALAAGTRPLKDFMIRQTREQDLLLMVEISRSEPPKDINDVALVQLVPAFMLSELKSAFQIGFVIFLPFLLIDLIISSVLMAMGMMMVPPVMISLPVKILMFVLIDGWNLIVKSLIGSFH